MVENVERKASGSSGVTGDRRNWLLFTTKAHRACRSRRKFRKRWSRFKVQDKAAPAAVA
jgi:hypothetical protein